MARSVAYFSRAIVMQISVTGTSLLCSTRLSNFIDQSGDITARCSGKFEAFSDEFRERPASLSCRVRWLFPRPLPIGERQTRHKFPFSFSAWALAFVPGGHIQQRLEGPRPFTSRALATDDNATAVA